MLILILATACRQPEGATGPDHDSATDDAYGFVVLTAEPGALTVERVSRGTPEQPLDNEVIDSVTLTAEESEPPAPTALAPASGGFTSPMTLQASAFSGDGPQQAS